MPVEQRQLPLIFNLGTQQLLFTIIAGLLIPNTEVPMVAVQTARGRSVLPRALSEAANEEYAFPTISGRSALL